MLKTSCNCLADLFPKCSKSKQFLPPTKAVFRGFLCIFCCCNFSFTKGKQNQAKLKRDQFYQLCVFHNYIQSILWTYFAVKCNRLWQGIPIPWPSHTHMYATYAHTHKHICMHTLTNTPACTHSHRPMFGHTLWSSSNKLVKIPKHNFKPFGAHLFSFFAPSVWNSLPASLQNLPSVSEVQNPAQDFLPRQAFPQV